MDGIVLLAKLPGLTSFSSLHNVKKAFDTTKVGHTGTLDSFAQGLLVVCTGRLTRLAGNITEFDKSYKAVIRFGSETETLDYEGKIVKTAELPDEETVKKVVQSFVGKQMQAPPLFSAVHIDGKRASEIARKGKSVEMPKREINVFKAHIIDLKKNSENKITECLVDFSVSKGTYIRCLARDIGEKCNSAAHLIGLYRTKVGNFSVEAAAGYSMLPDFSIETANEIAEKNKILIDERNIKIEENKRLGIREKIKHSDDHFHDEELQEEIRKTVKSLDEETAKLCGFGILHLKDKVEEDDFRHARPLRKRNFVEYVDNLKNIDSFAVFTKENIFCGLLEWKDEERNRLGYRFVMQEK